MQVYDIFVIYNTYIIQKNIKKLYIVFFFLCVFVAVSNMASCSIMYSIEIELSILIVSIVIITLFCTK